MPKMISQNTNNGRDRSQPRPSRGIRPASSRQQPNGATESQWRRNYDHHCALAQANNGGDAGTREQHWQHAEHFIRLINGSANAL
jgi:hypothetical protein